MKGFGIWDAARLALLRRPFVHLLVQIPIGTDLALVFAQRGNLDTNRLGHVNVHIRRIRSVQEQLFDVMRFKTFREQFGKDELGARRGKDRIAGHVAHDAMIGMIHVAVSVKATGRIPADHDVGFVFANQAPLTAQAGGFAIFVLSAGALLMAAHIVREERWLQRIVWVFIGMGALYVAGRTVELGLIDRLYHPGFSAGSMFWTWLVALALSQAVFNSQLKQRFRLLLILIVLVTFYAAIVQAYDWKSGWLPPLIAAAVILGIRFKRLSLFAIPAGLIFAGAIAKDLISSDAYSWGTRLDAWVMGAVRT